MIEKPEADHARKSDLTSVGHSDFIRELQRLHDVQRAAIQAKDHEAIEDAAHEMTTFLRLNEAGRLVEWFASRQERT